MAGSEFPSDLSDAAWRAVRATAADAVTAASRLGCVVAQVQGVEIDARLDRRGLAGARQVAWVRLVLRREQRVVDRAMACVEVGAVSSDGCNHG